MMCGIAGLASTNKKPIQPEVLTGMLQKISHRGPDSQGVFVRPYVGLGNRRLSIIDLSTGDQPISNEDKSVWVVLNGEIYNYRELRQQLIARGHNLSTSGDTEVLVHLYEDFGFNLVDHLRGMFAFTIWDERQRLLFAARDRIGIKPFYYTTVNGCFAFASELKALTVIPGFNRDVDRLALAHYLQLQYVPSPECIFSSVRKLSPGHILIYQHDHIHVSPYWSLRDFVSPRQMTDKQACEGLLEHILDAVQAEMVSDVPVGAFLSGGLDSSTVVSAMSQISRNVRTFAIGFSDSVVNETADARAVARYCHTNHHESIVTVQPEHILADLIAQMDEPFADASFIPMFYVSREARSHVKVALSGDGGDELFAGYERYVTALAHERNLAYVNKIPIRLREPVARTAEHLLPIGKRTLNLIARPPWNRYSDWKNRTFTSHELLQILSLEFTLGLTERITANPYPSYSHFSLDPTMDLDLVSRMQYLDFTTYMVDDILTKVDRMSMANSLEVRVPLLDYRLVEYVAGLPSTFKLRDGKTKWILRQIMANRVPVTTLSKGKTGFSPSLNYWFNDALIEQARALLTPERIKQRGFFQFPYVQNLFHQENHLKLWVVFLFELWCIAYLDT